MFRLSTSVLRKSGAHASYNVASPLVSAAMQSQQVRFFGAHKDYSIPVPRTPARYPDPSNPLAAEDGYVYEGLDPRKHNRQSREGDTPQTTPYGWGEVQPTSSVYSRKNHPFKDYIYPVQHSAPVPEMWERGDVTDFNHDVVGTDRIVFRGLLFLGFVMTVITFNKHWEPHFIVPEHQAAINKSFEEASGREVRIQRPPIEQEPKGVAFRGKKSSNHH